MTNLAAFWIGLILVAAMLLDTVLNSGAAMFFLVRKFVDLIDYLSVWR